MRTTKKWSLGIDLGTSNSALAIAELIAKTSEAPSTPVAGTEPTETSAAPVPATATAAQAGSTRTPEIVEITQRVTAKALGESPTMASVLYIPHEKEF
ncbi:MAG TPA: hypothetical protein VK970_26170, partial [Candidatus Methylacidiphilales bacterium]|nr:hypothetical protein [Candidatus Methylacidiphilales bacterium]